MNNLWSKLEATADDAPGSEKNAFLASSAISLKRIADSLDEALLILRGDPQKLGFVEHLKSALDDASFNHMQRMR